MNDENQPDVQETPPESELQTSQPDVPVDPPRQFVSDEEHSDKADEPHDQPDTSPEAAPTETHHDVGPVEPAQEEITSERVDEVLRGENLYNEGPPGPTEEPANAGQPAETTPYPEDVEVERGDEAPPEHDPEPVDEESPDDEDSEVQTPSDVPDESLLSDPDDDKSLG